MKHRISAGVLVEDDARLLLVRHVKPGAYDFWVAPGGGVDGREELRETVRREVREECGLEVEPRELAYIEELIGSDIRICKFWFVGNLVGGQMTVAAQEAQSEHIVEAAFLERSSFKGRVVYPELLRSRYWVDRNNGFGTPSYVGLSAMSN